MIQYAQIIKEYQRVCQCLVCSSELSKAPCRTSLSNPSCCRTEYLSFDMFLAVRFWRCELQQLEVKHGKSAVKQCKTCAVWLSDHVLSCSLFKLPQCSNMLKLHPRGSTWADSKLTSHVCCQPQHLKIGKEIQSLPKKYKKDQSHRETRWDKLFNVSLLSDDLFFFAGVLCWTLGKHHQPGTIYQACALVKDVRDPGFWLIRGKCG